jgi:hypothetical protein
MPIIPDHDDLVTPESDYSRGYKDGYADAEDDLARNKTITLPPGHYMIVGCHTCGHGWDDISAVSRVCSHPNCPRNAK